MTLVLCLCSDEEVDAVRYNAGRLEKALQVLGNRLEEWVEKLRRVHTLEYVILVIVGKVVAQSRRKLVMGVNKRNLAEILKPLDLG